MALVHEIIKCYSSGNNPDTAMKEIVERQKALSKEIKAIKQVLSKYVNVKPRALDSPDLCGKLYEKRNISFRGGPKWIELQTTQSVRNG